MSAARVARVAGGSRVRGADRLRRRYNLGPQGYIPVVRMQGGGGGDTPGDRLESAAAGQGPEAREVSVMKWGLVPAFAKRTEDFDVFKGGSSTFNARIESAEQSNMWRRLLNSRRGVVLFDGFYEWKTRGKTKTPMFIRNRDGYEGHTISARPDDECAKAVLPTCSQDEEGPAHAPLMLAALFDVWRPKDKAAEAEGEPLESATILTMEPDGTPMFEVHDRMPVFLTPQTAALWLDHSAPFAKIVGTVVKASQQHAQQQLHLYEVSNLVSSVKNESPDCILPKKEMDAKKYSAGLGRFFQKSGDQSKSADSKPGGAAKTAPAPLLAGGVLAACQKAAAEAPTTPSFGGLSSCQPSSREEEDAQLAAALAASSPAAKKEEVLQPTSHDEEEAQLAAALSASLAEQGKKRPAEKPLSGPEKAGRMG